MTYVKNYPGGWQPGTGGGTPITHLALDHIETQYDEAASDLNTHKSDPTAHGLSDGKITDGMLPNLTKNKIWIGSNSNRPEATTFDPSSAIPSGVIMMWSGTLATIPTGFALCDGTQGTPNLLDRFICSVETSGTNPGATGGATSKTTSGHTHSGGTTGSGGDHNHHGTAQSGGDHYHGVAWNTVPGSIPAGSTPYCYGVTSLTETSGAHTHTVSTGHSGSHTHSGGTTGSKTDTIADIRPKYYALAFIMKL